MLKRINVSFIHSFIQRQFHDLVTNFIICGGLWQCLYNRFESKYIHDKYLICLRQGYLTQTKVYNGYIMNEDWMDMNFQQNFNARLDCVQIFDNANLRIGKNILTNRLNIINNEIKFNWLNLNLTSFKLKCKSLYLNK